MSNKYIITQWGSKARPFEDFSSEERIEMLLRARDLMADIKKNIEVQCFLSYGVLLGAVRSGTLIAHDFDLDVGFMPLSGRRDDVASSARQLVEFLIDRGYKIQLESNGQFKASLYTTSHSFTIEFFAAWIEGEAFFQYFAVRGDPIASAVLPFSEIAVEGVNLPAPRQPEQIVRAIYGDNWQTPDPGFRYQLTAADWVPFAFLFRKKNMNYWDSYYESKEKNDVWVAVPSQFAAFTASELPINSAILEVGSGNGRDGLFFASVGYRCTLVDYSSAAINTCKSLADSSGLSIATHVLDITDTAEVCKFAKEHSGEYDIVYARFFLHAVTEIGQSNLLYLASSVLKSDGRLMAEYRSLNQNQGDSGVEESFFENGKHFRRLIDQSELHNEAHHCNLDVQYSVVGKGFAKFRNEDPLIGRSVLVKRGRQRTQWVRAASTGS